MKDDHPIKADFLIFKDPGFLVALALGCGALVVSGVVLVLIQS
jgi:hypothetical protein